MVSDTRRPTSGTSARGQRRARVDDDQGRTVFRTADIPQDSRHFFGTLQRSRKERCRGLDIALGPLRGPDACLRADCQEAEWPFALPRLPNLLERRLALSQPRNAPVTTGWSIEQLEMFQDIERIDEEDRAED